MSKVCFEAIIHTVRDSNVVKDGKYKLQVRLKNEDNDEEGKCSELKTPFTADAALKVEGDDCGPNSVLVFSYYRSELKKSDAFLGTCKVKVSRGIEIVKEDYSIGTDSAATSINVTIRDISASQDYMNSLSAAKAANAPAPGGKAASDSAVIPMFTMDDVYETNEAQTDAGESVKDFAKELATEFDISSHNVEELAFTTLRICDFPVTVDPAQIPELPMDPDIIQLIGIHPTDFKKMRESSTRSADVAGMHAYYDVLKRKGDISNLHNAKDFEWAEDEVLDDVLIPGTVSKWNEIVEVSKLITVSQIAPR